MSLATSNRDGGRTSEGGHLRALYKAFPNGGIFEGLNATQRGAGANMSVDLQIGTCLIPRSDATYAHPAWNDAVLNKTVTTADPSNPRRDILVIYIDYGVTPSTGVSNNTNGVVDTKIVAGTPAGSPSDPSDATIQAAVGSGNPWIKLARIRVGTGVTSITNSVIDDLRTRATPSMGNATIPGQLMNGQIQRTVASNNITLAIKTLAGNDPSETDPVWVRIGNTTRKIAAALSVTKNAGTNWFGKGASYFATNESDYFAYVGWNSTDNAVSIGFASIPNGRLYSDFSATTTNYAYLAYSGSAPASTDEFEVCGRFNAILGATASFNWSLPGTAVVIQRPIYETRVFSFTNTGNIAGTFYYQQKQAVKRVWGMSANTVTAAGGSPSLSANGNLVLPTGFFSAIQTAHVTATDPYVNSNIFAGSVQSRSTSQISGAAVMSIGSNGQTNLQFNVIGS